MPAFLTYARIRLQFLTCVNLIFWNSSSLRLYSSSTSDNDYEGPTDDEADEEDGSETDAVDDIPEFHLDDYDLDDVD